MSYAQEVMRRLRGWGEPEPVDVAAIRAGVEARHVYELEDNGTVLDAVCSCGGGGTCPDREDLLALASRVEQLENALRSVHCELYEGTRDGAFVIIDEALGEAPTDLVGHVAKVLHRDWSALPDWELRAAARFTLGAIRADGKVVVDWADLATWLDHTGGENFAGEVAALNRLRAALDDQQDGDGS